MTVVYAVDIRTVSQQLFTRLLPYISKARQERIKRFRSFDDAIRSLCGELLIRYGIVKNLRLSERDCILIENRFGKPMLENRAIEFNISHSGNWVVAAFDTEDVGIDIEHVGSMDLAVMDSVFTSEEKEFVNAGKDQQTVLKRFYQVWTLKESYIKSIGQGLSSPLQKFSVIPRGDSEVNFTPTDTDSPMRFFARYDPDENHTCALCCSHKKFPGAIQYLAVSDMESVVSGDNLIMMKKNGSVDPYPC
jgi:4'-phosphopantetheinyl transferase